MTRDPRSTTVDQKAALRKKIRIGALLVADGIITEAQLAAALAEQKKTGRKLGRTLIGMGLLDEDALLAVLARQLQIPVIDLRLHKFDLKKVRTLPDAFARRFRAIVLEDTGADFLVGMADPTDIFAYDELTRLLRRPIRQAIVHESDLLHTIDMAYRRTEEITTLAQELGQELSDNDFDLAQMAQAAELSDAPVVRLLQTMFEDAVQVNASDIHIEPDESILRIRQRIDGVLHEHVMKEKRIAPALVLRLKLMAGLDIAEKRLPLVGRFHVRVKGRSIDVRVSTMPVQHGESVVMRLLDQSSGVLDLDQLGMLHDTVQQFRSLIQRPHGMVLVTGPTGSGKTTTLYAALSQLNRPEKKIITVEDPVEYRIPRVNQVQVNSRIGLTFANVLRSALRQDPDIVLVGEMRDEETVQIGLRAAMTGHLVLSTLHTNDAVSTANRLLDMGGAGYLIAAALNGVVAQRLVRRICKHCAQPDPLDAQQRAWLAAMLGEEAKDIPFRRGAGCPYCHDTGYSGRIGVYELLEINNAMADALRRNDAAGFATAVKAHNGFRPLTAHALEYAKSGVTTLEEVIRVNG